MWDRIGAFVHGPYAPHGYCLLWDPALVWTHVVSDALIAAAYFSIPVALVTFVRRRRDIAFGGMFWLFALFILSCGLTHIMAIWNLWHGDYGAEALVKAVTAIASVPTAILLWPLIPRALAIPAPAELQRVNGELAARVRERDAALAELQAEIAQRRRAEEALVQAQKIEAVGQLTGGIAHDFNNLLQAVSGNIDLIRQRPDAADKVRRWADNASHGVERGTRLTGQLLAFFRTQRLELKPVDANALIRGMLDLLHRSIGPAVEVRIDFSEDACTVLADPTQIELTLLNLAINARDAMPDGGRIVIATRRQQVSDAADVEDGVYLEVSVSDTGTGMSPDIAARALEPFFTTKSVGHGTGLGLSMAFGVARQSGGTLRLSSVVGEGTCVTILLRCAAAAEAPAETVGVLTRETGAPAIRARRAGLRVMLVDDDDDVRGVVADMLAGLGYACESFAGGEAALAALDRQAPDLLLLDFAMPGLNGAEIARRARARLPVLPVLFISGYADSAAIDAVMDARTAVLRKPFHVTELARQVDERLGALSPV